MAKKSLRKKRTSNVKKSGITQLTDPVLESARDIWRAGLGAASLAQQEGSKVIGQGTAMFDSLVKEGARVEAEGRKAVDEGASTVTKKVKSRREAIEGRIDAAKKQAEDGWDRLENVFEDRVARVLEGLGIPTSDDMNKLNRQVENLGKQVARLADQRQQAAKAAKAAPAKATPAAKTKAKAKADKAPEATVYHLLPKEDQWAVRREGEDRNLRVLDTKREALDAARSIAQAHEPSRLVVHRADGTIQDSFSYGED
ncbi:MAG: phasin family protein [Xanthomonadales bacterium]|jgi:poly(hydroxyalkanoate) granule-associated protein|nr:phasin family protein [Xanthomonadales bacterium]